ncbi:LysR family transcriptional regulator ArgP [Cognatishimia activa]|uniref:Putative HTH-type transcriptional regulatorc/MT2039 n=1 Tax=Cognatishimia activa TaxID=1715691 RepID=A0A0P1JB61_9RHOB|nr:LysR family transcriptional regulator ArgP [Cognatishimia activa]CUI78167.1 putative HTH-type transcriptional regulatorc/MT2039 [Cognatishimia activa]CUK26802.1 putative HTH-type transcriptional regulatorc/MT2039 [Cognatishimia activa]
MKLDGQHLRALSAILRNGSFDAAAAELGVTQSAISQRLRALEENVGVKLVNREKPCTGTEAGRRIAAHADHMQAMEQALAVDLGTKVDTQQGRIRIAVNADSLATWFLDALAEVPEYLYGLHVDDQDFSDELLRRGEVAAAVTSNAAALAGCDVHDLGHLVYIAVATPDFMDRYFSDGVDPSSIERAPMLRFNEKDDIQFQWLDRHFSGKIRPPFHLVPSAEGYASATRFGLGWGLNPMPLVQDALKRGELVEIRPNARLKVPLYWQVSRLHKSLLAPLTRRVCQTSIQSLP